MDRGYDTRSPIQKKSTVSRAFTLFRVYTASFFVLTGIVLFFILSHAPLFKIRTVIVEGGAITANEFIQVYISKIIEGNSRTFMPFNSIISIPISQIKIDTKKTFASVDSIEIQRKGLSTLHVYITDKVPVQVYCKNESCVLLDNKSTVVGLATNQDHLRVLEGDSSEFVRRSATTTKDSIVLGKTLFAEKHLVSFSTVNSFLIERGFEIKKIILQPLGFFDVQAVATNTLVPAEFRFRDDKNIHTQIKELQLALENGLREKINTGTVEYVISYIPQKVIYKNKTQ